MEWFNIKTSTLRAPEFIREDPLNRATWLQLITYCIEQENGGVILAAKEWKDRTWNMTCGVLLKEVRKESRLWKWLPDGSLEVWAYPIEREQIVKGKRTVGAAGGRASGEARRRSKNEPYASANGEAENEANVQPNDEAPAQPNASETLERKGIVKGIVTEKEEKGTQPSLTFSHQVADLEDAKRRINSLQPAWTKAPHWGNEDERLLLEAMPNLRELDERDWQLLAWFCKWCASGANDGTKGEEVRLTSRRGQFVSDISAQLNRATQIWKQHRSPPLTAKPQQSKPITLIPPPEPEPPAGAIFKSLVTGTGV